MRLEVLLLYTLGPVIVSQLDLHVGEETSVIMNNIKEAKSSSCYILPGPSTVVLMGDLTKI